RGSTLARVRGGAGGRPTMREVAALAGVSLKTVSRVINAEPAVSDDVRSRVVGAIQRLDYRHDHAASSLRRSDRKTSTIGVLLEADSDLTDNQAGARQGVAQLIEHGHRRIGYLGDLMTITTAADRYQGYQQELATARIALDPQLVRLNTHGIDRADAATVELLKLSEPPSALFTSQNLLTIGASRALHRLDLHHRIALVGF